MSEARIKTFQDFNFSESVNYAEHKILNGNTLLEYTGKNSRNINFKVDFNSDLGINPEQELEALRDMLYNHEEHVLTIGEKVIGSFVIESISGSFNNIGSHGEIKSISASLNLKESVNT